MFRDVLAAVRSEVDGGRALASLGRLTQFHRIQSTPGYDAAAAWLVSELGSTGLEVTVQRVAADGRRRAFGQLLPEGWEVGRAVAWLVDGGSKRLLCDADAEPLSVVQRSAPAAGRFRIVDADAGPVPVADPDRDLEGAVALTSLGARRAHQRCVVERGAEGLLCDGRRLFPPIRSAEHDIDSLPYTSYWWREDESRSWGFVVTPRAGAELRERLRAGERLELEVAIESRRFAAEMPLVSAALPGSSGFEILVMAHLCHPRPGANDNGSGVVAALEAARALGSLSASGRLGSLRHGIRMLWMPELTGTFAWLAADPSRASRLVAALNLDMVGADQFQCGSTFLLEHPPCFAASFAEELLGRIRAESLDWITSFSGPGHFSLDRLAEVPYSGGSDHAVFVDPSFGVPCPLLIQWPDRFYHSSFDTVDRCDPRSLALAARCAAAYAASLATADAQALDALADLVERGARRRLLAALDRPEPSREFARERVRGSAAIESLGRLGLDARGRRDAFERFAAESAAAWPASQPPPPTRARRAQGPSPVPRRLKRGPMDFLDELNPGYERLDAADREALRELRARCPDAHLEIAWFAADGARGLHEIAALAALETGHDSVGDVEEFFRLTARMGLTA